MAYQNGLGFEPFSNDRPRGYPRSSVMRPYQHQRSTSGASNDLGTINENRSEDFSEHRPLRLSANITDFSHNDFSQSPSLVGRLTNSLRRGASFARPNTRSSNRQYVSVSDGHNDHQVAVDISSLEGSGFELREVSHADRIRLPIDQHPETAYVGAHDSSQAPSFSDFRRRTTGYGMMNVGARLERNNTIQSRESALQRADTIRKVGPRLAEQRGQIVACDLSFLGGGLQNQLTGLDEEDPSLERLTTADQQSYYFPPDPNVPDWKPFSMSAVYIIMLALIAFGLAGFQEYLCQVSIRDDGLLHFTSVNDISTWKFFVWKYLPTMITIFYATLFSVMDFDIRRLEPYYQLSQPQGARAAASLNLDHLTMFQYFVPFNAMRLGQMAVFSSSIANIIAATIAPALQNASVNFNGGNPGPENSGDKRDDPENRILNFSVSIDAPWSRALTSAYALVGLILVFLFFKLRRKSGLLSDPRGIAGIASMATKSHILQDFKGLDTATRGKIHKKLARRTYLLYKSSIWQGEYLSTPGAHEFRESERRLRSPHPIMLQLKAGIPFICILVAALVAVPVISVTPANIVPNKVSWLPILVATFLKMIWSTFEADVRLMEPFYRLSKGNCTARNSLTLDYQSTVYGWMPIRAALNRHWLVALVGLCSVFLDILSVTIGSFSVNYSTFVNRNRPGWKDLSSGDETFISFFVSLGLSCGILVFVIAIAVIVYAKRRHPFLPREPSTIASVLSFIYSSRMLNDFFDTELLDGKQMEKRLMGMGKRYGLGWFRGRDGHIHCAIDEMPMLSSYEHGKPYDRAVSGPLHDYYV